MIKINLKSQAQTSGAFVGGFDISLINIPMLIFAFLFTGLAPLGLDSFLTSQRDEIQKGIDKINEEKTSFEKELATLTEVEARINKMEAEETLIKNRIQVLQNLLKVKSNPMKIMHYIAEHIPANMWIKRIDISNKKMILEGDALDYESIGKFVTSLNEAIFFDKTAKMDDYRTKQNTDTTARLEEFKISASVMRFE